MQLQDNVKNTSYEFTLEIKISYLDLSFCQVSINKSNSL